MRGQGKEAVAIHRAGRHSFNLRDPDAIFFPAPRRRTPGRATWFKFYGQRYLLGGSLRAAPLLV